MRIIYFPTNGNMPVIILCELVAIIRRRYALPKHVLLEHHFYFDRCVMIVKYRKTTGDPKRNCDSVSFFARRSEASFFHSRVHDFLLNVASVLSRMLTAITSVVPGGRALGFASVVAVMLTTFTLTVLRFAIVSTTSLFLAAVAVSIAIILVSSAWNTEYAVWADP